MGYVILIGQLFLSLSILIVLHEMGHFFAARWFKTRVEKFYLFFDAGFSLFKFKKGDTEYGIGWLPLGGYVKIAGMIDESMDTEQLAGEPQPWEFRSKPAWQRLIIMLGGVTVNFVLGFFIFAMVLWTWGEEFIPAKNVTNGIYADSLGMSLGLQTGDKIISVGARAFDKFDDRIIKKELVINGAKTIKVERNGQPTDIKITDQQAKDLATSDNNERSLFHGNYPFEVKELIAGDPAEKAGVLVRDIVVGVNGTATGNYVETIKAIKSNVDKNITLKVQRGNELRDIALKTTEKGTIGAYFKNDIDQYGSTTQNYSFGEAVPAGIVKGYNLLADQIKAFGRMFSGQIKASESLGGFGTIGKMYGKEWIWERFWHMTAVLSLILAFMNLLPIPALDGGYVMFLFYEMITGRKPSDQFMMYANTVGLVIVLGLVLYANGMDVYRSWFK